MYPIEFDARTRVGPPTLETSIWLVPTPFVPNGSNAGKFVNWGAESRPRRTSPKPPPGLPVDRGLNARPPPPLELAWLLVSVAVPVPSSLFTPASIQNEADRPPPMSSVPRKPRRLPPMPELVSWDLLERLPEP